MPAGRGPLACVDIGSNTTRLLVAEVRSRGRLRELMTQRAFTRIGRSLGDDGAIPPEKLRETAQVVATQVRLARELGAERVTVVATAAIRDARNPDELAAAIAAAAGVEMRVLGGDEEAALAFLGATRTLGTPLEGTVAVLDVGGGSSEIAVGQPNAGVSWSRSLRIGSGKLADAHLRSDPPAAHEIERARRAAASALDGVAVPRVDVALAVGGSATSLRKVVGSVLDHETFERALRVLASGPAEDVAQRFGLAAERVRLLPAGVVLLDRLSQALDRPIRIGRGGLREGVLLSEAG